ncbi:hypothetical protein [Candidatus Poriferisodalis sp.]|uniref:hypothetical protein n=1 Tax=Candidatus Poriferisodalis sp. TaxID=3101277 RepID=UPI003B02896F
MRFRMLTALLIVAGLLTYPATAGAHDTADSECEDEEDAVLGDRADWAAVELVAWVLDTECLFDAGDRKDDALSEATAEMYDDHSVIVVGGTAAVPESKLDGLDVEERLWGADRLETMRAVVEWADEQRGTEPEAETEPEPAPSSENGFSNLDCYKSDETGIGYHTAVIEFDFTPSANVSRLYFEARLLRDGREVDWTNKFDGSPPREGQTRHYVLRIFTDAVWDRCSVSVE